MASFTFTVEGQHLRETEHRIVVSGSVRYLSAEFTFSDDWGDIPKYSFWTKGSVTHKIMLTDNKISPDENIYLTDGDWLVSVIGEDVEGEEIKKRITTNEVYVHVELNGPTEGDPFEDITPSIGEQIVSKANKSAEKASDYADEAKRSEENAKLHRDEAQQAEDQAEASAKSASKSAQDAHDSAEEAKKTVEDLPEKVDEYIDSHKEELKGEPGYTPQKGIDYFDGEPGYTPRKGIDYFDGYTPIKGIDYFDGEPGEPGPAYDDSKIKKEVNELSAGLANLSDEVDKKAEVFVVTYGTTTVEEIDNAYEDGKIIVLKKDSYLYNLIYIGDAYIVFTASATFVSDSIKYLSYNRSREQWNVGTTAYFNIANRVGSIVGNESSSTKMPSAKAVADYVAEKTKEPTLQKVGSIVTTEELTRVEFDVSGLKYLAIYANVKSGLLYFQATNLIFINVNETANPNEQTIFSAISMYENSPIYRGKLYLEGGMVFGEYSAQTAEAYLSSNAVNRVTRNVAVKDNVFDKVQFWTNTVFPVGSKFEIWGC